MDSLQKAHASCFKILIYSITFYHWVIKWDTITSCNGFYWTGWSTFKINVCEKFCYIAGNHQFNPFSKLLVSELLLQDAAELARKAEVSRKRAEDIAAGTVPMNGRELFLHEPWVFDDSRTWGFFSLAQKALHRHAFEYVNWCLY
jgi:hypothetical protein